MIIFIITRHDRDDEWSSDHTDHVVEAVTGTERRAHDRADRFREGTPDGTGYSPGRLTTYSAERVWTVDGHTQT